MTYLLTQIFLSLFIAFLLGIIVGWLLCKMLCTTEKQASDTKESASALSKKKTQEKTGAVGNNFVSPYLDEGDDTATIDLDTVVDLDGEGYAVETLEGIGPQTGELLRGYGIKTVGDFLRKLHSPRSREQAAKDLNILVKPLHDWAFMSDLLRIEGIDHQLAELTYTCGIYTVGHLARSNAGELFAEMETVNNAGKQKIAPELPTLQEVENWIIRAQEMSPVVSV